MGAQLTARMLLRVVAQIGHQPCAVCAVQIFQPEIFYFKFTQIGLTSLLCSHLFKTIGGPLGCIGCQYIIPSAFVLVQGAACMHMCIEGPLHLSDALGVKMQKIS